MSVNLQSGVLVREAILSSLQSSHLTIASSSTIRSSRLSFFLFTNLSFSIYIHQSAFIHYIQPFRGFSYVLTIGAFVRIGVCTFAGFFHNSPYYKYTMRMTICPLYFQTYIYYQTLVESADTQVEREDRMLHDSDDLNLFRGL